jgi:hypothetical protein
MPPDDVGVTNDVEARSSEKMVLLSVRHSFHILAYLVVTYLLCIYVSSLVSLHSFKSFLEEIDKRFILPAESSLSFIDQGMYRTSSDLDQISHRHSFRYQAQLIPDSPHRSERWQSGAKATSAG